MADDEADAEDRSWNWAYLIPILALMIPIVAIAGSSAWFTWVVAIAAVLGGSTLAGKYLLDHRHDLRMQELEVERRLLAEERSQLDLANRILEADEADLRRQLDEGGTVEH